MGSIVRHIDDKIKEHGSKEAYLVHLAAHSKPVKFADKYGNAELRALSWKQPFASLMLQGKIETRIWDTSYRGWVLICASKKAYSINDVEDIAGIEQGYRILKQFSGNLKSLPNGQAIAIGKLVDSRPMTPYDSDKCFVEYVSPWCSIRKDGSYIEKNLWCHVYEEVQPIQPFELKGKQGWLIIDEAIKAKIVLP